MILSGTQLCPHGALHCCAAQVVREDKVEHYPISRSVRPNGKPGHHFILNDVIRLWLACCVDEIVAEILTVPELRWVPSPWRGSRGTRLMVILANAPCIFGGLAACRFLLNGSSKQLLNIALGHDGVSVVCDISLSVAQGDTRWWCGRGLISLPRSLCPISTQKLNYLQAIVEHKTGLLDPRVHMERNGKGKSVAKLCVC